MSEFFEKTFYYNTLLEWSISMGIILLGLLVARVVYWFSKTILKKMASRTKGRLDDMLIDMMEEPAVFAVFLVGMWIGFVRLDFPEGFDDWSRKVFHVLVAINITWLIARLVDAFIREYIAPLTEKTESDLDDQLMPILRKGLRSSIWALGLIVALNNAGYNVGALLAGLGIGGIALAMAAKDTVSNFFGGLTIFVDKPFMLKDRIRVDDFDGFVEEIGIRSTRLRTLDGTLVTIPNSRFTDTSVENISLEPSRKVKLNLGLTYDTPPEKMQLAIDLLKEIVAKNSNLEENHLVFFNTFGDFSLGIVFIYYVKKGSDIFATQSVVHMEVLKKFNENKLDFAFPTQTIHAEIASEKA